MLDSDADKSGLTGEIRLICSAACQSRSSLAAHNVLDQRTVPLQIFPGAIELLRQKLGIGVNSGLIPAVLGVNKDLNSVAVSEWCAALNSPIVPRKIAESLQLAPQLVQSNKVTGMKTLIRRQDPHRINRATQREQGRVVIQP